MKVIICPQLKLVTTVQTLCLIVLTVLIQMAISNAFHVHINMD